MAAIANHPVAVIGSGRVASALARVLRERGAPLRCVAGRNLEQAYVAAAFAGEGVEAVPIDCVPGVAQNVIIAVSDAAVTPVAEQLAKAGFTRGIALHTCGSRGPEALAPLADAGVSTGVLYPLQTFPTPEQGARSLPGTYFAIAGDGPALAWARELVALIPGKFIAAEPGKSALFHAAAVMASNYQMTLFDAALEALECAGANREEALAALAPIARATLENTLRMGPQAALTGPISRGDAATVRRNLDALRAVSRPTQDLYRAAGLRTIPIAVRRGLSPAAARTLQNEFEKTL
ncbi:MAG: DUF2520 domain-containing protein [Bryobacterales bacterium]|nr:DUF2520 domain-containing protein [Bryobacterales bacterium]